MVFRGKALYVQKKKRRKKSSDVHHGSHLILCDYWTLDVLTMSEELNLLL
jgi:hypothetical protein